MSRSGDKRGVAQAGDMSKRGHGGRERGKGAGERGTAVGAPCRGVERAEPGELRGERQEDEGKADKRVPLVSCLERKTKGHDGVRVRLGQPWPVGRGAASVGEKRKEGGGLGRAQVGRWAVCVGFRPMVVKVIRV
jgi:hypothetical protein